MELLETKLARIIIGKEPNKHIKALYIFPSAFNSDKALQLIEFLKTKGVPVFVLGDYREIEKIQNISIQSFSCDADGKLVLVTSLQEARKVRIENKEGDLRVVALPLNQSPQEIMRLRWIVNLVIPETVQLDFQVLNLALIRLF